MKRWPHRVLAFLPLLATPAAAQQPAGEEPKPPPIRAQDVEKAIQEAMDRQAGVVPERGPPTETVDGVPTDKLGDSLPDIRPFPVPEVLETPSLFLGQRVVVRGMIRRVAQDGSWAEVAAYKSAPVGECIRVLAGPGWHFFLSSSDRRLTAYGELTRHKLAARDAKRIDEEAGEKPRSPPRTEWRMAAEGVLVQWLD